MRYSFAFVVAVFAFLFTVCFATLPDHAEVQLPQNVVDLINSNNYGWTAKRYAKFEGMTVAEARKYVGLKGVSNQPSDAQSIVFEAESIPTEFDSRKQWPNCIHPIRNQQQCGSCWAFAASEALSDRFCIASHGSINVVLSPQWLVECDNTNMGCNGGYLDRAWQYLQDSGDVSDACAPYISGNGKVPACPSTCANGEPVKKYKVKRGTIIHPTTEASIQTAIMTGGPVEGGFSVYQDFFSYSSGVYSHKYGSLAGGHAIKIVGWGVDNGTPYWIVANSWGTDWGLQGFFWIKRGSDECGIEDMVYAGTPDL